MKAALLIVLIPALNEEPTIADVVSRVPRTIDGVSRVEVIVLDDGSTDATRELALGAGAQVISNPRNLGLGTTFRNGISAALARGADFVVNLDGDGQFRPEDIPILLAPILTQGFGFVTCTRFGKREYLPRMPLLKLWGNRWMCRLINGIVGLHFTDVSCGFRAYSRETALKMTLFGTFTYTQESFVDLAAKGVAMTEVPLKVRGVREFGESRMASNLWRYGTRTLPIILRAMRDVRPLGFFGSLSLLITLLGAANIAFVGSWWLQTGFTSPWKSLIVVGTGLILLGVLIGVVALLADQLGRSRRVLDETLLLTRKAYYGNSPTVNTKATPSHSEKESPGPNP